MLRRFFIVFFIFFLAFSSKIQAGVIRDETFNINGLASLSAEPDAGDYMPVYDVSAASQKKVLFSDVISGVTSGLAAGDGILISTNTISAKINNSNLTFTSESIDLANTTVIAAAYGSSSKTLTATVDAKGRLTAMADTDIAIAQSQVTNLTTDLAAKANTAGTLAQFASTTSLQLSGVISDESGTGPLLFGTSPTITTPIISWTDSTKTTTIASPYSILSTDSGTRFNITGATAQVGFSLSASGNTQYKFFVNDSDGLRITMASGDVIYFGLIVSASGGYVQSTTLGSALTIECIDSTNCFVSASTGNWSVDS